MTTDQSLPVRTPSEVRRAERVAIAHSLLTSPPPLQALHPERVVVLGRSVVHLSRSRPVVRWAVRVQPASGPPASLAVIGKGYRRGGGEEAWQLLDQLRRAGLDDPQLAVPAPFGYDPARRLLSQEEAPPTTLHSLLETDPAAAIPTVERVGRWLARLHAVRGVQVPPLAGDFEQQKMAEHHAALATVLPEHGARLASLAARTVERLQGLERSGAPCVVTHGDFQPKNVHVDERCVVVIDFDRAALAPAARDLGHFIGQTLTMGASRYGSLGAAAPWVDALLRGYTGAGGDARAVAEAPAYVARTFAEVLFYRLVVRPVGSCTFVPTWLDAWESALGEPQGAAP